MLQRELIKKLQSLKPVQVKVILLALLGKQWKQISYDVNVDYFTVLKWKNNPVFKYILAVCQENMLMEISSQVSKGIDCAFSNLEEMVVNDDFEDDKSKIEAIKVLWEMCLKTADYAKVMEDNRRLINKEDFKNPLGIDFFEKLDLDEISNISKTEKKGSE